MNPDIQLARTAAIKFLKGLPEAQDVTLVDFDTEVRIARYGQQDFPRMLKDGGIIFEGPAGELRRSSEPYLQKFLS